MLININETYELITEKKRVNSSKDNASISNKFTIKPQGILIQDSYNNPFFPIRPRPRIDTAKFDLLEVVKKYENTSCSKDNKS